MKKRLLFATQIILLALFSFSLLAIVLQLSGRSNPLARFDDRNTAVYNNIEAYDPSLLRLNSLEKVERYCDSIYAVDAPAGIPADFEKTYTDIVSSTIRNRFYHGYSYYGFGDNYIAALSSKITMPGLRALVIPDEILKYSYAACSQQSIVMMEVLKNKNFKTRKITFQGKTYGGHFAFEVFYDGGWHFHDPNMEPDKVLLNSYGRPGIEFLVRNPEILVKAYNRLSRAQVLDLFPTYSYGPVNKFPAPNARIYQKATMFLSYTIWLFFLIAFIFVRRKYVRARNKTNAKDTLNAERRIPQGATSIYYPDYTAQRT